MKAIETSAPSNIALIKYMGKTQSANNTPANASISYTLDHLRTYISLEPARENELLTVDGLPADKVLSAVGIEKYLRHTELLQKHFNLKNKFHIRTRNNFPSDCGLASSASSFAALTLAVALAAEKWEQNNPPTLLQLSELSRLGSGSSCRSLYTPWGLWRGEGATAVESLQNLQFDHAVVVVSGEKKKVSSSEAHRRVTTSLLFQGRVERAEDRLQQLLSCLPKVMQQQQAWVEACQIVWEEFWDMHALFETSRPRFGYMNEKTLSVLNFFEDRVLSGQGPMVTMDAGPNVHLLYRKGDPSFLADLEKMKHNRWNVISSLEQR